MREIQQRPDGSFYRQIGMREIDVEPPQPNNDVSLGSMGEAALAMGSGLAGQVAGGLAGIWEAAGNGPDRMGRGAAEAQRVQEAMQYQPNDPAALQAIGGALQPAMEMGDQYLNTVEQGYFGDSPLGAFMRPAAEGAAELVGLGAIGRAGRAAPKATRMAQRVVDGVVDANRKLDPADIPSVGDDAGRTLQGYVTLDQAKEMGLPLTTGDKLALTAAGTPEQAASLTTRANKIRAREELLRTDPKFGAEIDSIREAQKDFTTNRIKAELDITGPANLTDDVLGDKLNSLGDEFDAFADTVGSVELGDDVLAQLDDVAEQATGTYGPLLQKIVDDAKQMAEANGGALDGADWQLLRTRLGKTIDSGGRQGDFAKLSDALELQDIFTEALESSLPTPVLAAMQNTRRQYGLVKGILKRKGNLSPDGRINANSLQGTLRSPSKLRNRQSGDLMSLLESMRFLETRVKPTSGSIERLLANPGRAGLTVGKAAAPYVIGGLGTAVGGSLLAD